MLSVAILFGTLRVKLIQNYGISRLRNTTFTINIRIPPFQLYVTQVLAFTMCAKRRPSFFFVKANTWL